MKKKIKKMILAVISVITVLGIMPYQTAFADEGGSIEITETATNTPDKRAVAGVKLGLYKIADVDSTEDTGYKITESFVDSGIVVKDLIYTEHLSSAAETLANYVATYSIESLSVKTSDNNGYIKFGGLSDGIYLIRQLNAGADFEKSGYQYTTEPYIVAIPSLNSEGNQVRNINCQPKGYLTEVKKKDTSLTVYKVWKDDNDKKGVRPEKIKVGLYKDNSLKEEVSLSAENNWMYVWKNLDKDGNWTVKELDVPKGYINSVANNGQEWRITNTYTPQKPSIVKTGDNMNVIFWAGVLVTSLAVIAIALYYVHRQKRKNCIKEDTHGNH